ncbi:ParB/RepB/Spo0J family partition protein [Castellaniella sp.]|uniref:ParB/RepB/Spo0J family partition protein n=1 Tax=Castellaniella sp. TaxID=1955812 RepID=UPI002AFE3F04|nr:ParB/RepB/Spo0J family partition protein [Castellaniella sp.]
MTGNQTSLVIRDVTIDALRANPWNTNRVSPENEAKIEASINRFGFIRPLLVRTTADGLEILGGQHRWEIAARLGLATVPVIDMGALPDKTAKEIGLVDNGRYGEDDTLELAELLKELGNPDDLAQFLPYTGADIEQIFSATDIDLESLDIPEQKLSTEDLSAAMAAPTSQVMRFKVPIGDVPMVERLIETAMKTQGFTKGDSLSNAGDALVYILQGRAHG